MYVFGGKDEDNEKLSDLWCFDFETGTWTYLDKQQNESSITSRSGHSACVYKDHMVIFAGIHEVTKELDDLAVYISKINHGRIYSRIHQLVRNKRISLILLMPQHTKQKDTWGTTVQLD